MTTVHSPLRTPYESAAVRKDAIAAMLMVRKASGLTRREVGRRMPGRWPRKYLRGVEKGTKVFSTMFVRYYITVCAEEIRDRAIARNAAEATA